MKQHPLKIVLPTQERAELRIARPGPGRPRLYSEKEMLRVLHDAQQADGKLTIESYDDWARHRDVPSSRTVIRFFGSWNEALGRVGLDISRETPGR